MKVKKVKRAIIAAFAAVFAFVAPTFAANVAKIGDVEYATIDAAVAAWKPGEMIELLTDIERDSYFVFSQNTYALDGKGHTIKCTKAHSKSWRYFVNANGGTQTFKNIIIDGNGKVPYVMQAIDGGKLILENVTIKGAKTTTTGSLFSRSTALGYGIHVNDGSVEAKNITITNCEVADVYQDGASSSFTLSGDNCNVNFIGSSSAKESVTSTAKGYYAYEVTYKSNLGNGTAKTISNKSLNGIIDQVQRSITAIVLTLPVSVEIESATVKLLQDVVLAETFTSNDTRLTINGNGKTITGTFKFSSTPSPISSVVVGNGSVLDCTASTTTGFSGVSVAANATIDILLPSTTDISKYSLPVVLGANAIANITVGDKKYIAKGDVITPAETLAQVGSVQYATLQAAIDAANGAVVHVLKDVALTSSLNVPAGKMLTLNLAGRKVMITGADYALVNNGNLTIVDMGLVTVVAAEATIGDETAAPILIMAPSANDGVAVIDDATGGSIAVVQNNGTFALESGAVVAASASVPAIDNKANAVATITGGTVEGKLQSVDKSALTVTGGSFTGNSNVSDFVGGNYGVDDNGTVISYVAQLGATKYQTLQEAFAAAKEFDVVTVLDAEADVSGIAGYVMEGLFPISNGDKTYTLRAMPAATVEKLPAFTLTKARDAYACWPEGDKEIDRPLDIVMNFLANDDGKAEANETGFADWKCDFYLTFSGMAGASLEADGCYLAGNYGGFGWIVIPADDTIIDNNATLPVVAAYDANITYRQICDTVKKFTAAIHVADAVMTANPDLKITLQLKMTNNKDTSQELVVGSYTYTIEDLKGEFNPTVKVEDGATVTDTFKALVGSGLANAYQATEGKLEVTVVEQAETFATLDVSATAGYEVPTEGLEMTFPAQSVKDNDLAIIVHKHEGKYYVTTGLVEYGFVKYNNTFGFSEFIVGDVAALNAALAEGGEVILSSDIVLTETLTIPKGKTITLDLNGKSISMEESIVTTAYALNNLGTLTLKDSVGTGSVNARGIYNGYGNGGDNVATAKITVESGTYNAKGTNGGAAIFNYGEAYINGGNISGNRSGCHVVYAWNAELTINGGTFYNNNSGNATIMSAGTTKCTITGGTFGIKDGRVEGNSNTFTSCLTDTANTATMAVTGGTFNGGFRVQDGTTMTIEGGSYNDCYGSKYNIYGIVTVKGGTFTDDTAKTFAANNLADGYKLGENGQVVAKPVVAKIGETPYTTLQAAIDAAQAGDVVTFWSDVEQENGVVITDKKLTVNLNGKTFTVSNGASTNNRNFKINGASEVVISNGTMVAAGNYNSGAYGTVRTEGTANVLLQDLKLYNYRGNGLNVKVLSGTTVTMTDVEIYSQYGGGVESAGGTVELTDVVVQQKGMYTAPYNSMAISVNGGGTVTVQSGTYSTECITAEEANNQGTSHGPWVAGVLNSGGTLIINGGTFSNDNFGENSLATYARGAILADTGANIQINGGTFNALKAVVDIQNNLGDASKNPTGEIKGGIFSADPSNGYVKVAEGYIVTENNGTYTVAKQAVAKIDDVEYTTLAAAVAEATEGQTITLISDVQLTEMLKIPAGKTVTLDLNGKQITSGYQTDSTTKHIYPFDVYGTFTIEDTVGNGSITGRGIFVQAGAKLTIESGSIYAIDYNGGSALFMYGGDVVINGGHIEQKAEGTYNFAINGLGGTVTVNNGWVGGNHGAIAAGGATVVLNGGTFVCTGTANMTDNVLYSYDSGSIVINGGTFIADNDEPSGGCCVYDANGKVTINGGSFSNSSGGDVWGTTGTTIKGGTFENLIEKQHIAAGYELNADGQVVAKPAVAQIGETPYTTLQAAIDAASEGDTITLLVDVTVTTPAYGQNALNHARNVNFTLDLNGKTLTANTGNSVFRFNIAGSGATSDVAITIKNGKVVADTSTWCALMAAGISADVKAVMNLENLTVECSKAGDLSIKAWDYALVSASNVTVNATNGAGGFYAVGGEIVLNDCTVNQKGLHTAPYLSMAFAVSTKGKMTVNSGTYSAEPTAAAEGYNQGTTHGSWVGGVMNSGGTLIINGGTFSNDNVGDNNLATSARGLIFGDTESVIRVNGGTFNALKTIFDYQNNLGVQPNPDIMIAGGVYSADPMVETSYGAVSLADGYAVLPNLNDQYVVGVKPTATVNSFGATTVPAGEYGVWNGSSYTGTSTVDMPLSFVMQFLADQTAADMATSPFADWYGDFVITFTGIENGSFIADGCYLAGYYGDFGWVKIPVDGMKIEEGARYPVMLGVGLGQKYDYICSGVQNFKCALFITPEILAANPNLQVKLELAVVDNSKGSDAAANALVNNEKIMNVVDYTYDVDDFMPVELPEVEVVDIKSSLTDSDPDLTFALNFKIKDMNSLTDEYLEKLFAKYGDYYTDYVLTISGLTDPNGTVKFNANGGADGYLAGQYDAWSKNWVSVPFENVTIQNGQSLYIMEYAAKLMNKQGLRFTLAEVAEIVQNFDCGVYFTPEFLAANPNLKVDLELKVFTEDANGNKVDDISVATNEFDKDDFGVAAVVAEGKQTKYFTSLAEAIAAANGKTVELLANVDLGASTIKIPAGMDIALDLNGKVISGVCNTSSGSLIAVPNTAKLTVKDSSNPSAGKITYAAGTSNVGWTIYNEGNLVLESGTIELTGSWSIGYAVDLRPNAWGAAYANASVFEMKGGNIVSSDGGVRVASTSHEGYANVAASFVMNGGKIDAAWDGVFIQQSNTVYDMLSFTMNGGTIESDLNPIRVYGPAPTDYVAGKNSINIALNGGTCTYTSEENRDGWVIPNVLRLGGGSSADIIIDNGGVVVAESFKTTNPVAGYTWVGIADNKYILARVNCKLNIKVINNEPYIGLGINTTVCPVVALKAATNLENPEWADVTYEAADDDADEYFWVKPTLNGNAYRFFKLAE